MLNAEAAEQPRTVPVSTYLLSRSVRTSQLIFTLAGVVVELPLLASY